MTKRIWYHKELKLMMIQYLNIEKTEDQKEEENSEDKNEDDQNEEDSKEEPHTEEPPPKEPTIEEPPQKGPTTPEEPPTKETQTKDPETENLSNEEIQSAEINSLSSKALLENIDYLMTQLSGELPDLGYIDDTILPLHTSTPIHEPQSMVWVGNKKKENFQCIIKDGIYALKMDNQEAPNQAHTQAKL